MMKNFFIKTYWERGDTLENVRKGDDLLDRFTNARPQFRDSCRVKIFATRPSLSSLDHARRFSSRIRQRTPQAERLS